MHVDCRSAPRILVTSKKKKPSGAIWGAIQRHPVWKSAARRSGLLVTRLHCQWREEVSYLAV